jgi:hypothetical protein
VCSGCMSPMGLLSVLSPHLVCSYVCLEGRLEEEARNINANGASLGQIGWFVSHFRVRGVK